MSHPIVHIELSANDHAEAAQWYADIFGWNTQAFPEQTYTTFEGQDDKAGGGFNPVSEDNPAGRVLVYIHTDDLKDTIAKIKAKGGQVPMESLEIPGVGTMAMFTDPTGNLLALLEPTGEM